MKRVDRIGTPIVLVAVTSLILALGGCTSATGPAGAGERSAVISIGPDTLPRICGVQWVLRGLTLAGEGVALEEKRPHVRFEPDGKLAGFASVTRFFGQLGFDDAGGIRMAPLGTTMMAGPESIMVQETLFLKGFQEVRKMNLSGETLEGISSDGKTILIFTAGAS